MTGLKSIPARRDLPSRESEIEDTSSAVLSTLIWLPVTLFQRRTVRSALAVINVLPSCVTTAEFTRSSWASVDANRSRPDAMSHKCSTFGPPLAAMVRLSYENASAPARREETLIRSTYERAIGFQKTSLSGA